MLERQADVAAYKEGRLDDLTAERKIGELAGEDPEPSD